MCVGACGAKVKRLHACESKRNDGPKDLESFCRATFSPMKGYIDSGMNTVYTVDASSTYEYQILVYIRCVWYILIPGMSLFNGLT